MILLDTNLLGRLTDKADPHYQSAHHVLPQLRSRSELLAIVPQNLFEFWAVATRPKQNNGVEMGPDRAALWITYFQRLATPSRIRRRSFVYSYSRNFMCRGFKAPTN